MNTAKKYPCETPSEPKTAPKPKLSIVPNNGVEDKQAIEKYKKLIASKIKDPQIAKKAAAIISEMINSTKEKK